MQIRSFQSITFNLFKCCIYPLTFLFIYHIMVTNYLNSLLFFDKFIWKLKNTSTWFGISNTDNTFPNHVHLINFLIFIINNSIFYVWSESPGIQTSCYVIYKLIILHIAFRIFCIIKESSILIDHIRKEIFNCYF